ncbi:MAG: hypothetical protein ACTHKQ_09965 [Mesorhizobium sp.]
MAETEMVERPADNLDRRTIVQSYMRDGMTEGKAVRAADELIILLNARARALAAQRAALSPPSKD